MKTYEVIAISTSGLLFFLAHLIIAIANIRAFPKRNSHLNPNQIHDYQIEAIGLVVPGSAGLLLTMAIAAHHWRIFSLGLIIAIVPTLIMGRAIYESIVFRKNWRRR